MLGPNMPTGHSWERLQICWVAAITATVALVAWLRPLPVVPPRDASHDSRPSGTWPLYADLLEANAATAEDLALLENVGPAIAERLVRARESRGGWCTLAEVQSDARLGVRWPKAAAELSVRPAPRCPTSSSKG